MSYLQAHPGFPQKIGSVVYTVKWMYSTKQEAMKRVHRERKEGKYGEVRYYPRKIGGKLFGKHPHMVLVKGRKHR